MRDKLDEIKSWLTWICLWLFCISLSTCSMNMNLDRIADSLEKIESKQPPPPPTIGD